MDIFSQNKYIIIAELWFIASIIAYTGLKLIEKIKESD